MVAHVEKQSSALRNKRKRQCHILQLKLNTSLSIEQNRLSRTQQRQSQNSILLDAGPFGSNLDNWDPKLLDLIAEKHHVIVVDPSWCRLVEEKWLLRFLEWLMLKQLTL